MELKVDRKALLIELELLQRITERKTSIPVLQSVLIEANGSLRLAATDLDISLRASCSADISKKGRMGLPARKLTEIVKSLPAGELLIKELPELWVSIESGASKFKIPTFNPADFPTLPEASEGAVIEIPGAALAGLISRVSHAITVDDARYYMSGALLLIEPGAVGMVATDGHRMAYAKVAADVKIKEPKRLLIPRKAVQEIARLAPQDGTVSLQESGAHLIFVLGERILAVKAIEGQFPAFEKVIDVAMPASAIVDREELSDAIRRVSLLSSERSRAVKLSVTEGAVTVNASSPEQGEASDRIVADYKGEPIHIGFNAGYVQDFLGATSAEKVSINVKDAESQGMLKPVDAGEFDFRYVVMPVRL